MQESRQIERAFFLVDLLLLLFSLIVAKLIREAAAPWFPGLKEEVPLSSYALALWLFLPIWAGSAAHFQLHRMPLLLGPFSKVVQALLQAQLSGGIGIALLLVSLQVQINRSLLLSFFLVSTGLLLLAKSLQRRVVLGRRSQEVALVLGPNLEAEQLRELQSIRGRSVERLPETEETVLRERLRHGGIHEIIFPPGFPHESARHLARLAEEVGIPALLGIERLDLKLARPRAIVLGQTLYHAYETVQPDQTALFLKALIDRGVSAMACLLLTPFWVLIALLIRLDSKGPVLFTQERGGLNGRPFRMYKFRTMRVGAELEREQLSAQNEMDGPVFKIRKDPRVTRVGRFLRKTSLDELPQLFNVLLGQMSLVGPRPLPMLETDQLEGAQRRRMSMLPGLTCLWQISGRNEIGFDQWMALDLQYIDQWSLGLDLAILLKTIPVLLTGRGAS